MKQSIVIVGGKGMLAHAIGAQLASRGMAYEPADLPQYNITQAADVQRLFELLKPSVLINCAAYTKVDLCEMETQKAEAINGAAVGTLAQGCLKYGVKFVHISTDFVFDGTLQRPYQPEDAPHPLSVYGSSKLMGEQLLRQVNPPGWIIARTAWLYGVNGLSFPRTMVEYARAGKGLKVVNDQFGSPTYTADLAEIILDLLTADAQGIFHTTNSGQTNWYEFATATLEEFEERGADLTSTSTEEYLKARPQQAIRPRYSVMDLSATEAAIGRRIRPWREALADFAGQVRQRGQF